MVADDSCTAEEAAEILNSLSNKELTPSPEDELQEDLAEYEDDLEDHDDDQDSSEPPRKKRKSQPRKKLLSSVVAQDTADSSDHNVNMKDTACITLNGIDMKYENAAEEEENV